MYKHTLKIFRYIFFSLLNTAIFIIDMASSCELKTGWILISWLLMKPDDQDSHCFQKRVYIKLRKKIMHTEHLLGYYSAVLIRTILLTVLIFL